MTIWKYQLRQNINREFVHFDDIFMPAKARILSCSPTGEIYALVDATTEEKCWHRVFVFGTGRPIHEDPGQFVCTVKATNGYVWHIFDGGDL